MSDTFERFTDRARLVIGLARDEARLLGHGHVGTEHLLLGLIAEGGGVSAVTLGHLDISLDTARDHVRRIVGEGSGPISPWHIPPLTQRAKKVLELSMREALQLGHNWIGTEHVLLALIREGEGVGARVLVASGAELALVRRTVIEVLRGTPWTPPGQVFNWASSSAPISAGNGVAAVVIQIADQHAAVTLTPDQAELFALHLIRQAVNARRGAVLLPKIIEVEGRKDDAA